MRRALWAFVILAASAAGRAQTAEIGEGFPLRFFPASQESDTLAVLYSGDGGWWGLENGVAEELAAHGIPVVGWNSLKYYWKARTPEEAAADLAAVLEQASARWQRKRIVLAGYSYGADTLPFIARRLPPELQQCVRLVALAAPWHHAEFEFHFSGWVSDPKRADSLNVLDGIAALKGLPVLCLYGRDDADASCEETDHDAVKVVPLPGGHALEPRLLSAEILKALH